MDFFTKIEATIADSKNLVANYTSLKSRLISIACIKSDVEELINEYGIGRNMKAYKDWIRQEKALVKKANSCIGIFKSLGKCCIFQLVERAELNNDMVKILEDIKELEKAGKVLKFEIYEEVSQRQQSTFFKEIRQEQSEFFEKLRHEQSKFFEEIRREQQRYIGAVRDEIEGIAYQQLEFFRAITGGRRSIVELEDRNISSVKRPAFNIFQWVKISPRDFLWLLILSFLIRSGYIIMLSNVV